MKKSQLSHRITWRVIGIILFFNVLTMGVIQAFVLTVSLMNSTMRGQYVIDGIEGKIESMLKVAPQTTANGRAEMEKDLEGVIAEVEQKVSSEFFGQSLQDSDGTIYFSIQITDYKGNRVVGSDSLDVRILKAKQEDVLGTYAMKDLKGTPYYVNSKKIADTDWTVIVIQHFQTVFAWGKMLSIVILVFMVIGLIVIFLFTRGSIRRATRPLGFLSESAQEVAKGNFDAPLPTFKHDDEVAQLRDSFGSMQQSLKQFIAELKVSTAAKAALESELNIARDIQLSMVPTEFPSRSDFDIYASMTPAKAVGGDLYDFFVRDNELVFCLGDVCGKGVPAALFMTETRSLFRAYAAEERTPDLIASKMNKVLSQNNGNMMFVTIFIGILDLTTGLLSYCNAGHVPPLIIGKELKRLPLEGISPIGLFADTPFVMHTVRIKPQNTILVYTDGLNEATTADNELFGDNRVFNEAISAIQTGQVTPKELIERQTQAVHDFVGDAEQSDDLTMLAIRYRYNNNV